MPVWADEAIYNHLVEIKLNKPERFKNILPLMGLFHWTWVLLKCHWKYLREFGVSEGSCEVNTKNLQKLLRSLLLNYTHGGRTNLVSSSMVSQQQGRKS